MENNTLFTWKAKTRMNKKIVVESQYVIWLNKEKYCTAV